MSDQDDFDQTLTPSQEYSIAFLVILLFGAMYWFFTQGSQPSPSMVVQSPEASQSSYLSSNYSQTSGNEEISLEENKPSLKSTVAEGDLDEDTSQNAKNKNNSDTASVDNDSPSIEKDSSVEQDAQLQQTATVDSSKLKEEAAALAAATSAQQIADEARFNAKQLELKQGVAELAIPPKPNDATQEKQPKLAAADILPKQAASSPAESTATKAFVMSDELARVDFKLPDGRTIQIPKQGFESQFKQSILQDDARQTLVFDRVSFFPGSDLLNPESSNQILGVAGILNTYKDIIIKLRGHTDSTGPSEENLTLSFKRSLNLKKQLVGLGINTQRIQVEGLGSSEPISDNGSEQGRNKNRRIDLTIIR
jgi:outer membrane protein OmpA-like peptidoglycan-associated protein